MCNLKRKRHTPGEISHILRDIQTDFSQGKPPREIALRLGVSEQTLARWRREHGADAPADPVAALKDENHRLRRKVADLELDKRILTEAVRGNF